MNRVTQTTLCCFALCVLSLLSDGVFASPVSGDSEMSVNKRQNEITITCPRQVSYRMEANPQWEAGFYGIKRLMFADASVSGRTLTCNYSASSGSTRDSSMLTREMPFGYVCKSERHYGAKNWEFLCKRPVAPIKIKPKSD